MNPHIRLTATTFVAAAAILATAPATSQEKQKPGEERRVIVDVEKGAGPNVWHFETKGGYLGVDLVELTPELRLHFGASEDAGVMVGSVGEDSPAQKAGLMVGDVLTAIDGVAAESRGEVARLIREASDGQTVSIDLLRAGRRQTVSAVLEERERPQLLLSRSGNAYAFRWRSDDEGDIEYPTPFSVGPGATVIPPIEPERLEEIMGQLHERLESPEFQAKMLDVRSKNKELEERVRQLEARLKELSQKLEQLDN